MTTSLATERYAEPVSATATQPITAETRRQNWVDTIQTSIRTSIQYLEQEIEEHAPTSKMKGINPRRRGNSLVCKLDCFDEQAKQTFKPGTRAKIVSKRPGKPISRYTLWGERETDRTPDKSSFHEAEVASLNTKGDEPEVRFTLLNKGPVYTETALQIRPRSEIKNLQEQLIQTSMTGLASEEVVACANAPIKAFLTGDFNTSSDYFAAPRPELDRAQNEAYGRAMMYDKQPVLFIHGGPGTGKTTTLCKIIEGHAAKGRKVLVLSHSNKGAQVPALMLQRKKKSKKVPIRVAGNDPSVIAKRLRPYRIKKNVNFPEEELRGMAGASGDVKESAFSAILGVHQGEMEKARLETEAALKDGGAVFSTLGTLLNDEILNEMGLFDVVIVDEATRLRMPDLLLALNTAGKQIIFVGDPLQLGNIPLEKSKRAGLEARVKKDMEKDDGYATPEKRQQLDGIRRETAAKAVQVFEEGPFSNTVRQSQNPREELPYVFLDTDRRSRGNIVKILSELIYSGKLVAGRESKEGEHEGIVEWIDTGNIKAQEKTSGTSKRNTKEADVVVNKVLDKVLGQNVNPDDIAVIATYSEQAKLIRRKLAKKLYEKEDTKKTTTSNKWYGKQTRKAATAEKRKLSNTEILERLLPNIASVDAFQGDERKIVFVSLTRSNEQGAVGFLEEERRIGVAIGRAQDELYIVGDAKTLTEDNSSPTSKEFFTKMHELIGEHGKHKTEQYRPPKRKRCRRKSKKI